MKYKPTYGDKQREAQKRRKDGELRNPQLETEKKQVMDEPKNRVNPPDKKKRVA